MELFFLALLVVTMALALGSGYPVAFALPGAAIISIVAAAVTGFVFTGSMDSFFHSGGPGQWLSAGVTNLRGVYWEVERDTLIAIPLFIFMGIMLQRSKIAEDLLLTMAQLFGPIPGGLGISVVFVGALLAATTGILGATVVAMGLISLPAMLRKGYSAPLASGTIAASGTLGQLIPPSIVLIILADQLASATDQASTARKALHKEATGELSMPSAFDVASTSAGEMFLGAFVPGLVLVGLYMLFILLYAIIRPKAAPAVPYEGTRDARFWGNVVLTLVPPLGLIFLVLGSIIAGVATVNQAGAIGAAGAMIMAGYRLVEGKRTTFIPAIMAIIGLGLIAYALATYDMNVKAVLASGGDMTGVWLGAFAVGLVILALIWSCLRVIRVKNTLHEVMIETAKTTSLVFIILLGAAMLTAAFRAFGGEELVREFLNALPGGFWTQFVIVMAVIFFLGFFLDFIEIAVVVVPIVAPILLADPSANITAVWLGVMIGLNIQTSFLTPPFGFALFYLRGVAPAVVKTVQIYKGVIAFICLQLVALGIVGYYPQLVNYLPNRVSFLSETAPPPRNPKLQVCLVDYVHERLLADGAATTGAIAAARQLDLSVLPESLADDLSDSFDDADTAVGLVDDIYTANVAVNEAAPLYRPVLREVRYLEKQMRRLEEDAKHIRQQASFLNDPDDADRRAELEAEADAKDAERDTLQAQIPEAWEERHTVFARLTTEEQKARMGYQRAGDGSVGAVIEVLSILDANPDFAALKDRLMALGAALPDGDRATLEEEAKSLGSAFSGVSGADKVRSEISKVRSALREGKEDREKALKEWNDAVAEYTEQEGWRAVANTSLYSGLVAYRDAMFDTVGSRQQPKLSREQALFLASCGASHRDLSLNF